jgi:hypothetical protein
MSIQHTVQQGDCIVSIADQYGLYWETVWNFSENAALRALRASPSILFPGDVVAIPDQFPNVFQLTTNRRYRLVGNDNRPFVRLQMQLYGEVLREEPFQLFLDDATTPMNGTTDASGEIRSFVPVRTQSVTVVLPNRSYGQRFLLGNLDPIDSLTGVQARLRQLGYYQGDVDGAMGDLTTAAITGFQADEQLTQTGTMNAETTDALQRAYGS